MLALLLAAGVVAATHNVVPFQLSVTDQSPLVQFTPAGPGGWNSSFSQSAWSTYTEGQPGIGESLHYINTSTWEGVVRPSFSVGLSASDVIVMGDVNGSPPADNAISATVTVYEEEAGKGPGDGQVTNVTASQGLKLSSGQLARVSNLSAEQPHLVEFTITDAAPSVYNVRSVIITTALWSKANSFDKVPQTATPFVVDGKPNPEFQVDSSSWTVNTSTVYGTMFPSNLTELYAPPGETRANVTIQIPPATAFILIRGTVGPGRSFPTYQWTPAPPNGSLSSVKGGSADSPWVSEQVLYAQRLDPDLDYVLDIAQSRLGAVALSSVTFYSANITEPTQPPVSDPGRSKTPVGVIVGAILAVAGLTILVSVGFHFLVRRPRKRREREEAAALAGLNAGFVPFGTSDYNTQPPPMQETDAGALDPPPQYQPEWSTDGRSATTGSTSALTPLASWKEPYINGTYTQQEAPLSASSTANATLQGAGLPRGAAPAETPVSK